MPDRDTAKLQVLRLRATVLRHQQQINKIQKQLETAAEVIVDLRDRVKALELLHRNIDY